MTTAENIQSLRDFLTKSGDDPEKFFPSCIGCGYCCLQATCALGIHLWGTDQPCLGLYWDGEKYRCHLAINFAERLYIGCVCCSPKNYQRDMMKNLSSSRAPKEVKMNTRVMELEKRITQLEDLVEVLEKRIEKLEEQNEAH